MKATAELKMLPVSVLKPAAYEPFPQKRTQNRIKKLNKMQR